MVVPLARTDLNFNPATVLTSFESPFLIIVDESNGFISLRRLLTFAFDSGVYFKDIAFVLSKKSRKEINVLLMLAASAFFPFLLQNFTSSSSSNLNVGFDESKCKDGKIDGNTTHEKLT